MRGAWVGMGLGVMRSQAVCAVIIGNEVLTAKVAEANGTHLIRRLRERGVELASVHFMRDEVDDLVEQLTLCRRRARFVITSGGVGPTHDDVTVRAVALALCRQVVRLPEMEARIRAHYAGRPVPMEALRMAEAPAGSRLLSSSDTRFPVLACEEIYMLPGVPQLFALNLETVLQNLPGKPLSLKQLFLSVAEADIASTLDAVARARPHVSFGSYPTWGRSDHRVRVTVEHESEAEVQGALEALEAALGAGVVIRRE